MSIPLSAVTPAPWVEPFFDEQTHTFSYVVTDQATRQCSIIDSVLDYDAASAHTSTVHADRIINFVEKNDLRVIWILETHVHADHLSAAQYLKSRLGGRIAMSEKISLVQKTFGAIYHLQVNDTNDMSAPAFDYLFTDGEYFQIGSLTAYNIPTPGHTPACLSYVIGDAVFVGDTVFMPDYGTARCDFPNGSASALYDSIQRLYQLDDTTRVFLCHDYRPEHKSENKPEHTSERQPEQQREYQCLSSIGQQKRYNIHLNARTTKQDFVAMREQRDATLDMPKLILPAIQVNMNAGKLPEPESNGIRYLKIPLNTLS